MSDLSITFPFFHRGAPADIVFRLALYDSYTLRGSVEIAIASSDARAALPCYLLGWDLDNWRVDIRRLHKELDGSVELVSAAGHISVTITVIDRGRGWLRAHGHFEVDLNKHDRDDSFRLAFAGLESDQSYLPAIAKQIDDLINASGVSTVSPWQRHK